jgi:hypothetical protein
VINGETKRRGRTYEPKTRLTLLSRLLQYRTEGRRMMNLKREIDGLIESTMAFANDVKRRQTISDLPVALRTKTQPPAIGVARETPKAITDQHPPGRLISHSGGPA